MTPGVGLISHLGRMENRFVLPLSFGRKEEGNVIRDKSCSQH
jgi:hypothetical protein